MTAIRSFLASLGVALAAIGLVFVMVPGVARTLSLPRIGVIVLGVIAIVEALRSLQARRRTPIDGAELPAPETREATAYPGDGFDDQVGALGRRPGRHWRGGQHERLRGRLRAAAVEAAAHRWRLSYEAARERIAAGEWTDDPAASWFLGDANVSKPPWPVRIQAVLDPGPSFAFYATRSADAVAALREAT